jgi:hypothetical protein
VTVSEDPTRLCVNTPLRDGLKIEISSYLKECAHTYAWILRNLVSEVNKALLKSVISPLKRMSQFPVSEKTRPSENSYFL